ncbi:hypothetical protein J437_LFUL003371 [Ladona fulva]|uniref:MADF domain-containing protein n=1 Tax=Ladona fulva TaxID=123851 RepID=A0A8K0NU46_LADFU|nr:hypothetical protein J437_LFUL003371 [Ladona fulva]
MTMEYINNLRLIHEVKKYPCMYDLKDPNYKDMDHRRSTWEVICRAVYEKAWDDFKQPQRKEAAADVQKRWKALRDAFTKAYKMIKARDSVNGSGKRRRPYVYSNQLEFLIPFINPRSDFQNSEVHDFDDLSIENTDSKPAVSYAANSPQQVIKSAQPFTTQQITTPPTTPHNHREESQRLKRKSEEGLEIEPPEKVAKDSKNMDEDPDKMFLLSLLPSFKRIKEAERLDVQIEILQCIKRKLKS